MTLLLHGFRDDSASVKHAGQWNGNAHNGDFLQGVETRDFLILEIRQPQNAVFNKRICNAIRKNGGYAKRLFASLPHNIPCSALSESRERHFDAPFNITQIPPCKRKILKVEHRGVSSAGELVVACSAIATDSLWGVA